MSAENVSTIAGQAGRAHHVELAPSNSLLPQNITGCIQFYDPEISTSPTVLGFVTGSVGIGEPTEKISPVVGLLDSIHQFYIAPSDRVLPLDITGCI